MLFLGLFYLIVPKLLCFLGILLSLYFGFMLRNNTCSAIKGTYRILMLVTIGWNVLTAFTDSITSLAVQNIEHKVFLFDSHRTFLTSSYFEAFLFLFRLSLILTGFQMTTFHFLYRFLILKNAQILKNFCYGSLIVFYTVVFSTLPISGFIPYVSIQAQPTLINFFDENFGKGYGVPILISGEFPNSGKTWIFVSVFGGLILAFIITWLVLGYLTYHSLTTGKGLSYPLSFRTTTIHLKLSKVVWLMAVIPGLITILLFAPVTLFGILGVSVHPLAYTFPSLLMSMSPFLTTLAIILNIDSLRNCFKSFFRRQKTQVAVAPAYVQPTVLL